MDSEDWPEPTEVALPVRRMMAPAALADASLLPVPADTAIGSLNLLHAVLRVITHQWWKILAICVVLTAGLVYTISVRVKPTYQTYSLLRVDPGTRDLFGHGGNAAEVFHHFLQTQVQLIKSPPVLSAALANREVADTQIVRTSMDPESELGNRLEVGVVPETYLIKVAMTAPDPSEAALIVNNVVNSYVDVAAAWSSDKNKFEIANLERYSRELGDKIEVQKKDWLILAGAGNLDLESAPLAASGGSTLPQGTRSRVTVEEFKQVREQLFRVSMDLIEAEALLNTRRAEIAAQGAGVDPELLAQKRIEATLRKDPEIVALLQQIDRARHRYEEVKKQTRFGTDPSRVKAQRALHLLETQLADLVPEKRAALLEQAQGQEPENPLLLTRDLTAQIDAMKIRKTNYEQIMAKLEVVNRQEGTDTVKVAFVREDLANLKEMQRSVLLRIEQLHFDSRGEARIKQLNPARSAGLLVSDNRRKFWILTPIGVLGLVLGLFLFLEIRSGRVADLDDFTRRVPVEVYAIPALPGTRKTSDQRALRANEIQLQEFLQSLDHLRVSLWFGKEAVAGTGRCLAVTSAIGGEGKTTLSAHLAVCCAKAGISTLVIDADLRRAALSRMFEEEQTPGLSDVLKGDLAPEEAVVALRDGGFHLLPAGSPGQHPGWLFREQRIGQVLARYRQMFDLVIIDTPPVLPVPDALSLGRWVDGAVMVIRYDMSRFLLVDRARKRLIAAGIPILKTVVNGVKSSRFSSGQDYGYGYGGSYGYDERTVATGPPERLANDHLERTAAIDVENRPFI